jgi:hypothetical protein
MGYHAYVFFACTRNKIDSWEKGVPPNPLRDLDLALNAWRQVTDEPLAKDARIVGLIGGRNMRETISLLGR